MDILPPHVGEMLLAVEFILGGYLAARYWERVNELHPSEHLLSVVLLNGSALAFCGTAALDTLSRNLDPATMFGLAFAWLGLQVTAKNWAGGKPPAYIKTRPGEFDEAPHHHAQRID